MENLLPIVILFIVALLAVGQVALALYLRDRDQEFLEKLNKVLGLPQQERQSWSVWHATMRKMQAILGKAELEGVKVVADSKYYTKELEKTYERQLDSVVKLMEQEIHAFFEKEAKTRLQISFEAIEKDTLDLVFQESAKARADIEEYKKQRMVEIEQDLKEVISKTAKQVIGKAISLDTHEDLIKESFEAAAHDKFI